MKTWAYSIATHEMNACMRQVINSLSEDYRIALVLHELEGLAGTKSHSCAPDHRSSLGMDVWTLFLMSAVVPDRVAAWFKTWRANITTNEQGAYIDVQQKLAEIELSSKALATAWAFCLAKELGLSEVATDLSRTLGPETVRGFQVDPLISGLYLLGDVLDAGAFHALVAGRSPADARGPTDA